MPKHGPCIAPRSRRAPRRAASPSYCSSRNSPAIFSSDSSSLSSRQPLANSAKYVSPHVNIVRPLLSFVSVVAFMFHFCIIRAVLISVLIVVFSLFSSYILRSIFLSSYLLTVILIQLLYTLRNKRFISFTTITKTSNSLCDSLRPRSWTTTVRARSGVITTFNP